MIPHLPDHQRDLDFGDGLPVLLTEKDAVKLRRVARPGGGSSRHGKARPGVRRLAPEETDEPSIQAA